MVSSSFQLGAVRTFGLTRSLEPPKLDLEAYIANYSGAFFTILLHILRPSD